MQYALDQDTQDRIEASPNREAVCPVCRSRVRAKCGSINIHHWAHIHADCDPWSEPESFWHRRYKEQFPVHTREVVLGRHRADVYLNGYVLELQASPISVEVIQERENFYNHMIWMVKADAFWDNLDFYPYEAGGLWWFNWKYPRKSWFYPRRLIVLEHDGEFFLITNRAPNYRCGGVFLKSSFIADLRTVGTQGTTIDMTNYLKSLYPSEEVFS